jgi:hypothetical protein
MSFSALHKLIAYLLSGLGLVALCLGNELEQSSIALIFLAYAGSLFAEGKLLEHPAYAKSWTAAVVGLLLLQLARSAADTPTLAMAIEFAAFLQISRLWNRRTAVDYQQIAVLAFLHLIAATVLSTSLSYALIFIGFVIATPWMLALSHLRREIEGNYPTASPDDDRAQAAIRRVLASKRVVGASFLVSTALLAVPLFAMTLTIFVIVPRVGQGFLSLQRSEGQRSAGFGNQIELGGFGVIRDDPTVVLRVTPLRVPTHPSSVLALRMRGTSFDHYDGRRWTRSPGTMLPLPRSDRSQYPIRRPADPDKGDIALRILLDHLDEPVVFLPTGTVALSLAPRIVQGEQISRELIHGPGLDVRYADPDELGLMYTAFISRDPREADIAPSSREQRARYLEVPTGHERVAALAQRVTQGAKDADESAEKLVTYLHSARFGYSLEQPDLKGKLPLDVFLFDVRRGHCEYFASAMAIMLRTLGIPARNVTGFVGGRWNPYGGYYALRQGDAHSWVEAYVEGRGWVSYDPTPPGRADAGPRQNWWSNLQALIDAMRTRWMTSVVGYDLRTQAGLLRGIMRFFSSHGMGGSAPTNLHLGAADAWKRHGKTALLLLLALAVLAAFVWWWMRRRGAAQAARPLPPHVLMAVKLYRDLERVLSEYGYARPVARTPIEHVSALAAQGFVRVDEVREITEHYMEVRYGGRELEDSEIVQLKAALARVRAAKAEARAATSGDRRAR